VNVIFPGLSIELKSNPDVSLSLAANLREPQWQHSDKNHPHAIDQHDHELVHRIGIITMNVESVEAPEDTKGKPHLEKRVGDEEAKVQNATKLRPVRAQSWVYNIGLHDEQNIFKRDHDESELEPKESHGVSDDSTKSEVHKWLFHVVHEDHAEPRDQKELDGH